MRAIGNRSGTQRMKILLASLPPASVDPTSKGLFDKKALAKYRKMLRNGGESAWPALPLIGWWKGKMVVDDGSHRIMAAVLEGKTEILCDVEPA